MQIVNVLSIVMYSASHRRAGAYIQSAVRNAPDLGNNVSLAVSYHLVSTVARKQSLRSPVCVYTYVCFTMYRRKIIGQQCMPRAKEIFPRAILGTRAIGLLAML